MFWVVMGYQSYEIREESISVTYNQRKQSKKIINSIIWPGRYPWPNTFINHKGDQRTKKDTSTSLKTIFKDIQKFISSLNHTPAATCSARQPEAEMLTSLVFFSVFLSIQPSHLKKNSP